MGIHIRKAHVHGNIQREANEIHAKSSKAFLILSSRNTPVPQSEFEMKFDFKLS